MASSSEFASSTASGSNSASANQDQAIHQQQTAIENEIKSNYATISPLLPVSDLATEFKDNPDFLKKIEELCKKYSFMRKTRPDGNCFYRAFAFAHLEHVARNPELAPTLHTLTSGKYNELIRLGYPDYTTCDFFDQYHQVLEKVASVQAGNDSFPRRLRVLEDMFDSLEGEYLVACMRLLVSLHIQQNESFYEPFCLSDSVASIKDFCSREVEPMNHESDHVHMMALADALGIPLAVEYLDRASPQLLQHTFGPPIAAQPTKNASASSTSTHTATALDSSHIVNGVVSDPSCVPKPSNASKEVPDLNALHVTLLYRPGHLDILYSK